MLILLSSTLLASFYTYFLLIFTIHIINRAVLYFALAFNSPFYFGAYFTEQYFTGFYTIF